MSVYQVLVVDDSAFMRKIITDLIEQDSAFKVMGTAVTGEEAIEKARICQPDLITMDVEMPVLNGLDALKVIMSESQIPIIMLSGINELGLRETIMALEAGAFDFIRKPSFNHGQDINEVGYELRNQMKEAMQMKERRAERKILQDSLAEKQERQDEGDFYVIPSHFHTLNTPNLDTSRLVKEPKKIDSDKLTDIATLRDQVQSKPTPKLERVVKSPPKAISSNKRDIVKEKQSKKRTNSNNDIKIKPASSIEVPGYKESYDDRKEKHVVKQISSTSFHQLVAIGCSTGGPRALKTLLSQIPVNFPAPIVIVQHMPPDFTRSLASRLDSFSHIRVVEAEHGMLLEIGTAYIAPGGYHMRVNELQTGKFEIFLSKEEIVNGHRPSVDALFESIVPYMKLQRHVVLLTGMGSDGARMMKRLYDTGVNSTFAENEESCVVYGMPRAAVELACVQQVLPIEELTSSLIQAVMKQT
ncbi:chemotaxis protein CheB [Paenibacillus sp. Marseille-Q4541]|uniref:chemotaxis protein CheB n=1 Tax=Paenibacillus sp. Marseille-Q4541 TaxID=2831522 RepID=UPI001BA55263|nr:chemotaxis protein CheB [Paenibacillus sp. Marseille-Q4541]